MDSGLSSPIDAVDREIASRLSSATSDWQSLDASDLSKHQAMALQLLVWSGLLEMRLKIRAWGGSSDAVVRAECVVSGDYRKTLPDEIRKVAPSLGEERVIVQPDAQGLYRLTISGAEAQADLVECPMDPIVLLAAKRVLPGQVSVRIINVEHAVRTERPGATAVAQASASVGDIVIQNTVDLGPLAEMLQPGAGSAQQGDENHTGADAGGEVPTQAERHGVPEIDPHDDRVVNWVGKRLYLGRDTQMSRLFWLLAVSLGRPCNLGEVQRAVHGMETHAHVGSNREEIIKAQQRLRTVISKLRERMREAKLDIHFAIVKEGPNEWPSYAMMPRFG